MHGCTFISNHNSTVLAFVEHCYTLINNSKWNKLIIYVRTSHDCVLIIQPSSNFADRFFSFICWHLLHLGFGAFGMLQVPQEIRFSLAQKLLHLLSLCPIIQTAVNNFVTVFTSFGSDVGNSCSKTRKTRAILCISLGHAGVGRLLIIVNAVTAGHLSRTKEEKSCNSCLFLRSVQMKNWDWFFLSAKSANFRV